MEGLKKGGPLKKVEKKRSARDTTVRNRAVDASSSFLNVYIGEEKAGDAFQGKIII